VEDGSGNWEAEPFLAFAIESIATSDNKIDSFIVKGVGLVAKLDVAGSQGGEVTFCCRRFDFAHDLRKPVCDGSD